MSLKKSAKTKILTGQKAKGIVERGGDFEQNDTSGNRDKKTQRQPHDKGKGKNLGVFRDPLDDQCAGLACWPQGSLAAMVYVGDNDRRRD